MSRVETASLIIPIPSIGGHIDSSARVSVPRAPWQPAVTRCGARPETAPSPAPIRGQRPRAASISTVLRIIRQEHQAHGEARQ